MGDSISNESTMNVPEHIYVAGNQMSKTSKQPHKSMQMIVPDRIIVGGGDQHIAVANEPIEILQDRLLLNPLQDSLINVPQMLTANDYPLGETAKINANNSQASIAIDENPIGELKKMRRIVAGLTHRVKQIEDDRDSLKNDLFLWKLISGVCAAFLFGLFIKKR